MNLVSYIGGFVVKKNNSTGKIDAIKKTDTLGKIMTDFPEVAPVLAGAGLHCIGCHVSTYETIEEGCLAHGMKSKDVTELVKKANERVKEYDSMTKLKFSQNAVLELDKRLGKPKKKFVRIVQNFGEFDFDATDSKEKDEIVISVENTKKKVDVLLAPRIERMLRGVVIDYDSKQKDFVAKRE